MIECVRGVMAAFLTACDRHGLRTRSEALSAGVNAVASPILILSLGTAGAAIATVAAETILVRR